MSEGSKIKAEDIKPGARAGDIIGYLGMWHGGASYSLPGTPQDHGEFFPTIKWAADELRNRYHGYAVERYFEWQGDGFIVAVKEPASVRTPAVDTGSFMDLYALFRDPDGDVTYADEPCKRLELGPRGGVRVESW